MEHGLRANPWLGGRKFQRFPRAQRPFSLAKWPAQRRRMIEGTFVPRWEPRFPGSILPAAPTAAMIACHYSQNATRVPTKRILNHDHSLMSHAIWTPHRKHWLNVQPTEVAMGIVLKFPRHARASTGYRSGRNSCREMPDTRSSAMTLNGGTSSHCDTACFEIPNSSATLVSPPADSSARLSASLRSCLMDKISTTALSKSQATVHWTNKVLLYNGPMTIGARIRIARKRLDKTQKEVADHFGITVQAVSAWERGETKDLSRERIEGIATFLEVSRDWLEGKISQIPALRDRFFSDFESLTPEQQIMVRAAVDALRRVNAKHTIHRKI